MQERPRTLQEKKIDEGNLANLGVFNLEPFGFELKVERLNAEGLMVEAALNPEYESKVLAWPNLLGLLSGTFYFGIRREKLYTNLSGFSKGLTRTHQSGAGKWNGMKE